MAGFKIAMPANASTDWSDFVTRTQHAQRTFMFVSLTNTTSTGAPAIEEGSYGIVNGTIYSFTPSTGGNETISTTGLSTGLTWAELWIKEVPSTDTAISAQFTTVPPVWSAAKGGYYSTGNDRYIGGCCKSSDGAYGQKWVYKPGEKIEDPDGYTRPWIELYLKAYYWDMDALTEFQFQFEDYPELNVNHQKYDWRIFMRRFRVEDIWIRDDNGDYLRGYNYDPGFLWYIQEGTSSLFIHRDGAGPFDNANYDSTSKDPRATVQIKIRG